MSNRIEFTAKERSFVYGVALKYMKDEERANDVAQDAMMQAYRYRHTFRGDSRPSTWLYRIAATTALMHLRKDRRRAQLSVGASPEGDTLDLQLIDPHSSPEEIFAAAEATRLADLHLARMGERYREIFALRYVDGYSESEVARRLKMHVATVKTRAYRARSRLQAELSQAFAPVFA